MFVFVFIYGVFRHSPWLVVVVVVLVIIPLYSTTDAEINIPLT